VSLVEKEEEQLKKKKSAAIELSKTLASLTTKAQYSVPRIKFIEESDLSEHLYNSNERWIATSAASEHTWWGFHDHSFTEVYGHWIDWSWARAPKELKVRLFSNAAAIEQDMQVKHPERMVKPLPTGVSFDSSMWTYGDFIWLVQTRVRPHYMVEIHDPVLARNQRELFKGLWSLAT